MVGTESNAVSALDRDADNDRVMQYDPPTPFFPLSRECISSVIVSWSKSAGVHYRESEKKKRQGINLPVSGSRDDLTSL